MLLQIDHGGDGQAGGSLHFDTAVFAAGDLIL